MDKLKAKQKLNLSGSKPVLAILGGSQGSAALNHHYKHNYINYTKSDIEIIWQCGKNEIDTLQHSIDDPNVHLIPFSKNMATLYSAADIIVSRSGALTLSEMALLGKAMVLVPFPSSAGNHQIKNAETFSNSSAAIVIHQAQLPKGDLETVILDLIQKPKKRESLEKNALKMATPNSIDKIISVIMETAVS